MREGIDTVWFKDLDQIYPRCLEAFWANITVKARGQRPGWGKL
jgi:hypothetical protein